jgi:hypothetical protein
LKQEFKKLAELNKPKYFFVSADIEWSSKTTVEKKMERNTNTYMTKNT